MFFRIGGISVLVGLVVNCIYVSIDLVINRDINLFWGREEDKCDVYLCGIFKG